MKARIEVSYTHLGGPSTCVIETELEPESDAWNERTYEMMAKAMNGLLAAIFKERDEIVFEKERTLVDLHQVKDEG